MDVGKYIDESKKTGLSQWTYMLMNVSCRCLWSLASIKSVCAHFHL